MGLAEIDIALRIGVFTYLNSYSETRIIICIYIKELSPGGSCQNISDHPNNGCSQNSRNMQR